ncbi:Cse1-domain-containing protein [Myxozyma melibiosi]|uniref:Cse1-domain-containing protein n=1 Tax=Myxozyma melibiosi TaxID=54550 RepID=A0ABR1F525_9ASCO
MALNQELQQLSGLLEASLSPATAKQAEQSLRSVETQQGFSISLLKLVASDQFPASVRLAGSLYFKNFIRRKWTDEEGNYLIPIADVEAVKTEIVGLMISLQGPTQIQLGEAISIMADSDFPDRWTTLIDDLVSRLTPTDVYTNNGVLRVAHSIFKRWRPLFSSNELLLEIKHVLEKFCVPFMSLFQQTDVLITQNEGNKEALIPLFQSLQLILKIYFDLNCQDIPEFFEDNKDVLMALVLKYLQYNNPLLVTDDEDETGPLEEAKSIICELLQLYTQRYDDVFGEMLPPFVETTWNLLTTIGLEPKYDVLVSKALGFLTTVTKNQDRAQVFGSQQILQQVVEKIVLPNMSLRQSDEEMFEDDPIEYTRRDLEGSDSDTRRRAATDFLRELKERFEGLVTEVVMSYVQHYLQTYNSDKSEWRAKDTAVYLFSSVAVKGTVTASGASATNMLLDVVGFFSQNIAPDLVASDTHAILKVDAIKFIHTFRNQLTKAQLTEAFPVLSSMFLAQDYVVYTYAAITIERILSIKQSGQNNVLLFDKDDVAPVAEQLLTNLFRLIEKGQTPEKLAENEFLMMCLMRVVLTARESIAPYSEMIMQHLVGIITETSKNPSNPKFTHYMFETVGAVLRYAAPTKPPGTFDSVLLPVFMGILGQDVTEFMQYVFQLLSQLLDVAPTNAPFPDGIAPLVRPILSPSLWETKGNVPALTHLLISILARNPELFVQQSLIEPLLGVFQKLIAAKANDHYGFELLESILYNIPVSNLRTYLRQIALLILQRLHSSRTEKLVVRVSHLVYFLSATTNPAKELGPDFAVSLLDEAQPGIFSDIFDAFVVPATPKLHSAVDKKIAVVGLTRILFESAKFNSQYGAKWARGAEMLTTTLLSGSLVGVFDGPVITEATIDPVGDEEVSFGSSFARLATVAVKVVDPAPDVSDAKKYAAAAVQRATSGGGSVAQPNLGSVTQEVGQSLTRLAGMA